MLAEGERSARTAIAMVKFTEGQRHYLVMS
jgi:hypothetical protein